MKTCLDYGWMTLTDTGEWKPNAFVTRAEFAADLARFAGIHTLYPLDGAARFSDVDLAAEDAPYLAWAADSGIVAGYDDGTFRPEKTLTREQMAVMLARYYARSGVTTQGSLDFADAAKISGWAVDGVSVCVGLGLVQGDSRGRFLPQSRLTRAQIASSSCGWQDNKMGCPDVFGTALFSYSISMRCPSRSSSWRACRRSDRYRRDAPA